MAQLEFTNAYQVDTSSTPAGKESNSHDFFFASLGATTINDGGSGYTFSGNDVAVISIIIGGTTYYGWISRPVKSGGDVKGFYFWTDQDFTDLAAATADGNTDGDSDVSDNLGFILVVDQAWFDALGWEDQPNNIKNVGSSSDGVDDDLNSLLPPPPVTVTITEDSNDNGVIGADELSGNVDVSVALPGGLSAGDELTISDGLTTQTVSLTNALINAGVVTTTFAPPAEGATITVSAYVTTSGGQGATDTDSALLDTTGPLAPVVVITEDANNNGVIAGNELSGDIDVSITLPADAVAGDELSVSDGLTTQTFTLTGAQVTAGSVTTTFAAPAEGGTITVTAFVTDQNGNIGASANDSALLDTVGPSAPMVVITEDANNDGVIAGSEFSGDIDVSVTLPGDAVEGDTLSVSDGLTTQLVTLTGAQITAGTLTTTFAAPAEGGTITVTAFVTDQNGNEGASASDSAVLDTTGPSAPTVVITEDANNDAVISGSELSGNVDVSVTLPGDAVEGDELTVTDGLTIQTFTLTGTQITAGSVSTSFAPPADGGTITVTAFVTDQYGNQGSSASDLAVCNSQGPAAPTVVIVEDANDNGVITAAELSGDVDVTISLPDDAIEGDVLTVTDGSTTQDFTLTAGDVSAGSVSTTFAPPAEGSTITVTAYVTDQASNQGASASDSALRQLPVALAPTVIITEDANNNGIISGSELNGNVNVSVVLPGNAVEGDVLTVTDGDTIKTFTLTAAQVTAGTVGTTFAPPGEGGTITVTAFVTNQSAVQGPSDSDSAKLDTIGPSPITVVITEDVNNNTVLTPGELIGDVDVSIALPASAVVGDVLTVTDGVTTQKFTLTAQQIGDGAVTTAFTAPAEGATITVTAYVTDQNGNQGTSGSDFAMRLTVLPGAIVITEDVNNNGVISGSELSGNVDVLITLPDNAIAGDMLTVTDGTTVQTMTLTALQVAAGSVTTSFMPPAEGGTITATAFVTDQFGMQGPSASDSAVRDTVGPSPMTVIITEDANNNALISSAELSGNVDVLLMLAPSTVAGDVLTVTDGLTTQTFTLTATQVAAGSVVTAFAPPATGAAITVTAFTTDQFGNQGAAGSDAAVRENPVAPVYSVLLANGDRFYSIDASEAAAMAQGTGNVFEGARFDSLTAQLGGEQIFANYQPFTMDWYFAADGVAPPYACYERVPEMAGFMADAVGQTTGESYHLYLNGMGVTQLATQAQAAQMNLAGEGYIDRGAQFSTTATTAFTFDAEGYLMANKQDATVQALVHSLALMYTSTSDARFVDSVEQHFLARAQLTGVAHGEAATAADLNAAFGTTFAA